MKLHKVEQKIKYAYIFFYRRLTYTVKIFHRNGAKYFKIHYKLKKIIQGKNHFIFFLNIIISCYVIISINKKNLLLYILF